MNGASGFCCIDGKLDFHKMAASIAANAEQLRRLSAKIKETFRRAPQSPQHHAACEEFHRLYDSLAFPDGLQAGLEKLKSADPATVEIAIQFLETDPHFFRSGYIKEKLLRRLKHCDLTEGQRIRLRRLVLYSIEHGGRREFVGFSHLARVVYSPPMLNLVLNLSRSTNAEVGRRAAAVLHVLESQPATK